MNCNNNRKLNIGFVDEKANDLKAKILESLDCLPQSVTGNIWYVSSTGDNSNSGNSKDFPWRGLEALAENAEKIKAGDAVLFERGGIYRGAVRTIGGVYYGAYGQGEKPRLYGSLKNYALSELWQECEKNIWSCGKMDADTGIIVFVDDEFVGYKKFKKSDIKQNGDFWCDSDNTLYIYWEGNPAESYESIEIGTKITVMGLYDAPIEDITIENLCIKYTGAHAIAATDGAKNITVRNCEIGYIGGSIYKDNVRYGNGVEFYNGCENILVEYNWIYQIYDSGFTHQGNGNYAAKNIEVRYNLIEGCGMGSVEYWLAYNSQKKNYAENVTYSDNIMRNAGYCWGGVQRPDKVSSHILSNGKNQNHFINYQFKGNIFDRSSCFLMEITSLDETYPTFSDNIYIQDKGMKLGTFAKTEDVIFDDEVQRVLNKEWGDNKATIIFA